MRIETDFKKACSDRESVIAIGKFDGVHKGHEKLLASLIEEKEKGLFSVVFAFTFPREEGCLSTIEEKAYLLGNINVDLLVECPFTDYIKNMEAQDFLTILKDRLKMRCIVAAGDIHFGKNRAGDEAFLKSREKEMGFRTVIVDKKKEDGKDISSTWIRQEILAGNMEKATRLLGYPYFLTGEIIHGAGLGKKIFNRPTLNLMPDEGKLLPPFGVYLTETEADGKVYQGISNLGVKPTVSDKNIPGLETHLLDFGGDFYGRRVKTSLLLFLREERKFTTKEELRQQIDEDSYRARNYFGL